MESASEGVELVESEVARGANKEAWTTALERLVNQQMGQVPLRVTINKSTGVVSSTPRTPSPMPRHVFNDMLALKLAMEKEKVEEKRQQAKEKGKAKGGKQKVATPPSSSGSLSTSPSEGEEPAQQIQARPKGQKKPTQKASANATPKTQSGTKGKSKGSLEASTSSKALMQPPVTESAFRTKRPVLKAQASTST